MSDESHRNRARGSVEETKDLKAVIEELRAKSTLLEKQLEAVSKKRELEHASSIDYR